MVKLDLSKAWDGATRRLSANRELMIVLGGVFFFLPYLAFTLFTPQMIDPDAASSGSISPDELVQIIVDYNTQYWWALLLLGVVQLVGTLAVINVLGASDRPTVGSAMSRSVRLTPTLFGAQILTALASAAPLLLVYVLSKSGSLSILAGLLLIPAMIVALYVIIKLSLTSPVIAIDKVANPLMALRRSWQITKGNSLRLLAFYALLLIAFFVLSSVFSLVTGVVFALAGDHAVSIGTAIVGSLVNTLFAMFSYGVVTALHRQLSGNPAPPSVPRAG